MNKVIVAGEVLSVKEDVWNSRTFSAFVVETKRQYKDKKSGEMKSWSTRVKCSYEHPDLNMGIGDFVYAEGSLSNRPIESDKGKVWITEVKCDDVNVLRHKIKIATDYGPPPMTNQQLTLDNDDTPF